MKTVFVLSALIVALLGDAGAQASKALSVTPERTQRVEILYFPERVELRVALSPERLEQGYCYKLEIRDVQESAEWKRLLSVLRETSVEPSQRSHDYRTAVLLFDQDGQRVSSVYFDQFGGGTINGDSGTIKGGLYRWAKSMLRGVAE
jgi:hypothetical protein